MAMDASKFDQASIPSRRLTTESRAGNLRPAPQKTPRRPAKAACAAFRRPGLSPSLLDPQEPASLLLTPSPHRRCLPPEVAPGLHDNVQHAAQNRTAHLVPHEHRGFLKLRLD